MQVCEEHETFAEKAIFLFDRLFDLDDHAGQSPDIVG